MGTEGADASYLARTYGLRLDDWQENVLADWLAYREDSRWAAGNCGIAVPRQNGKNAVLEARELYGMVMLGEKILHTAHEVKTARKAYLRLCHYFDNPRRYPQLFESVLEHRKVNGEQGIFLHNGGSIEFIARSKGSGRGFTVDVLVRDEAQELSDDTNAALRPTISAAPLQNPQVITLGTPPSMSMNGEVFTRMRAAAHGGLDQRLAWSEWAGVQGIDIFDPRSHARYNPSYNIRLLPETIEDELSDMDEDTFARERCGRWDEVSATGNPITPTRWKDARDPGSKLTGRPSIGLDVRPDASAYSIGVAGLREDGKVHGELVVHHYGTGGLVDTLVRLATSTGPCVLVVDPAGPAGAFIAELISRGFKTDPKSDEWRLMLVGIRQYAQACGALVDKLRNDLFRHIDQEPLNAAVEGARIRAQAEGAYAWSRKDSNVDISPLVSVTLADHGLATFGHEVSPEPWVLSS